jgi:hypothetical protein
MQRRIEEGKTKREAMRSLKRQLSRHLYKQLTNTPLTTKKHPLAHVPDRDPDPDLLGHRRADAAGSQIAVP